MGWRGLRALLFDVTRCYSRSPWFPPTVISLVAGASYMVYLKCKIPGIATMYKKTVTSGYEKRFRTFASVKYNGVLFMTPKDFLESIVRDYPESLKVTRLSEQDVESLLRKTPPKSKGSIKLFRNLGSNGLISFTEYLFLQQILTKPHSCFELAFKMLDTDRSGAIDANEFSTVCFLVLYKTQLGTTLMRHLFNKNKEALLTLNEFTRFTHNIQTELLDVEFQSRAIHSDRISATDFARILLRYTTLSVEEYDGFIQRLNTRLKHRETITFQEFQKFFNFLNSLDDFSMAMKMYTLADRPISLPEFNRAVKACTGSALDAPTLRVVFELFDTDGDGCLSYQEFIQIMRERKSRGLDSLVPPVLFKPPLSTSNTLLSKATIFLPHSPRLPVEFFSTFRFFNVFGTRVNIRDIPQLCFIHTSIWVFFISQLFHVFDRFNVHQYHDELWSLVLFSLASYL
ncbi:EF-hand domain-containing family member A1 [Clonorchis sinensis]|uniref:EF-hand domain-containing family member A1 n=1 Tax=Clonorchis sinensis TaxID=79923 RepID=G7Y5B2_CLOSI|nr:EF-hand domain-containing family member A1 [Clonorchis sinensis]